MRRSPLILAGTIAGTAGVLAFHAHTPAVTVSSARSVASASASSGSGASATATGDAVDTQYGPAQVRVTVESGRITNIEAVQLQGNEPRSVEISSSAEPILQQEALTARSAGIDAVSGATFTSASYAQSLQSALDKLGFKAADGARATLQVP